MDDKGCLCPAENGDRLDRQTDRGWAALMMVEVNPWSGYKLDLTNGAT